MPIDKFGRHLHQHHPPDVELSKLYLVNDGSSLKYYTMWYVMGINADDEGQVNIINSWHNEYRYKLPTGTIKEARYPTHYFKVFINGVEKNEQALLGLLLKTGDKISVKGPPKSKAVFALEFLMEIPLFENGLKPDTS